MSVVVSHSDDRRMALRRFSAPELSPGLWAALWSALAALVAIVVWANVTADEAVDAYRWAFRLIGTAFVACGLVAWRRRPDSYSGLLMTMTGFLMFVEPLLAQWDSKTAIAAGHPLLGRVGGDDHLAPPDAAQRRPRDVEDGMGPDRARSRSSRCSSTPGGSPTRRCSRRCARSW